MKIGDVAKLTGTSTKTIRFYEEAGLLPAPERTASGYRDYDPEIAARLEFIRRGQAAGLSLHEVREILSIHDHGDTPCRHVRAVLRDRLDQVRVQRAELLALEGHLESLLARANQEPPTPHDESTVCWILEGDLAEPQDRHIAHASPADSDR